MMIRFDGTVIDGVLPFDGYISIGTRTPEQIAELILQRLSGHPPAIESANEFAEY